MKSLKECPDFCMQKGQQAVRGAERPVQKLFLSRQEKMVAYTVCRNGMGSGTVNEK